MKKLLIINMLVAAMAGYAYAQEQDTTTTDDTAVESQSTTDNSELENDKEPSVILSLAGLATAPEEELENDDKDYHLGAAVLVESNVNDVFGVETGVMYVRRQYVANVAGAKVVSEVDRLHIPITARIWATDFLSLAAGPYVAFSVGDVDNRVIVGDTNLNYETSADDDTEFGLDLAATFNIAIDDKSGLFIEGRYSQPLEEESEEDYDKVTALAGFKIDM